jgi:hypothetical protein
MMAIDVAVDIARLLARALATADRVITPTKDHPSNVLLGGSS